MLFRTGHAGRIDHLIYSSSVSAEPLLFAYGYRAPGSVVSSVDHYHYHS